MDQLKIEIMRQKSDSKRERERANGRVAKRGERKILREREKIDSFKREI